jgi:L-fucose isomerase-like protein
VPALTWQALASPLHDAEVVAALTQPWRSMLASCGACELPSECSEHPLALLLLTGGTEALALRIHQRRPSQALLLLAHGAHNSLPAALETLAALRQNGAPALLVLLDGPGDPAEALRWGLHAVHTQRSMLGARLGLLGGASSWLIASRPSPELVLDRWGPLVIDVPMAALLDGLVPGADADAVHRALAAVVAKHRLDAVSVRCFDLLGERGTTACLAMARLGQAGVPAGCEGDLPSAVALLWVHKLLGSVPWMANPARLESRGLWLAHCTVPLHLVSDYRLDTHFESGLGVGVAGRFEPGPVTLLRIGGAQLEQLWTVDCALLEAGSAADQCRTQALVSLEPRQLEQLLERPLGNHLVLVPGHHASELERWWRCLGPGRTASG